MSSASSLSAASVTSSTRTTPVVGEVEWVVELGAGGEQPAVRQGSLKGASIAAIRALGILYCRVDAPMVGMLRPSSAMARPAGRPRRRPAMRPLRRGMALLVVVLTVLLTGVGPATARSTEAEATAADSVVVVGVAGLTWADIDPERTPELWGLAGESTI